MMSEVQEPTPLPPQSVGVAVIGAGPAGLMAAQVLSEHGIDVDVYDAMASAGRKFLLAGRGGLNLTHAEPHDSFVQRYGHRAAWLSPWLDTMGGQAVREWAASLGIETFVGTSQRVFPVGMKAAPLLRAWLHCLRHPGQGQGLVRFHMRHRWCGWANEGSSGPGHRLMMSAPTGVFRLQARTVILALGGGSWSRLGSDGAWVPWLEAAGVTVAKLQPSNCGFDLAGTHAGAGQAGWSDHFRDRFAGQPFKSVVLRVEDSQGQRFERKGEFVATTTGIEGSLVYAASAMLRDEIRRSGSATLTLDLLPDRGADEVLRQVSHPRGSRSLSSHLKSRLGLEGIKTALLYECLDRQVMSDPASLARAIKAVPLTLAALRPLDEVISTAGGVVPQALNDDLMLTNLPGVFCAGEMLDWEAPTGGYLLTACLASGRQAGEGAWRWLQHAT